ncbi:unnamed protein product, partial [Meganyctiphanes norvegica]
MDNANCRAGIGTLFEAGARIYSITQQAKYVVTTMRRKQILFLKIGVVVWLVVVYILVYYQPVSVTSVSGEEKEHLPRSQSLSQKIEKLEHEISEQSQFYISLLNKLKKINQEREESQNNALKKQHRDDTENKV